MTPLIPNFYAPELHIGSFVLQTHGLALVAGAAVAISVAWGQSRRLRLDTNVIHDCLPFVGIAAIFGGHFFYSGVPSADPQSVWVGQSMTGALLVGGIAAIAALGWARRQSENWLLDVWHYLNVFALAALAGGAISKVGCFLCHERVGSRTTFWLGVQGLGPYGSAAHDLGLYDALALGTAFVLLAAWTTTSSRNHLSVLSVLVLLPMTNLIHTALSNA